MLRCCEGAVASGPSSGGRRQSLGGEALATPRQVAQSAKRREGLYKRRLQDISGTASCTGVVIVPLTHLTGLGLGLGRGAHRAKRGVRQRRRVGEANRTTGDGDHSNPSCFDSYTVSSGPA